jgi:hypothetical protein
VFRRLHTTYFLRSPPAVFSNTRLQYGRDDANEHGGLVFSTVDVGLNKRSDCERRNQQRQGCIGMPAGQQPRANGGRDPRRASVENAGLAQWQTDVNRGAVADHDPSQHRAGELGEAADDGQAGAAQQQLRNAQHCSDLDDRRPPRKVEGREKD